MADDLAVVLDTNVIVSGIIVPSGTPAALLDAWKAGRYALLTSLEQIAELERTLRRPTFARKYGIDDLTIVRLVARLHWDARMVAPPKEATIAVRDPDDERILMIGVSGQGRFLVTGDNDLLTLADDPRLGTLQIVTARAFRQVIEQQEADDDAARG